MFKNNNFYLLRHGNNVYQEKLKGVIYPAPGKDSKVRLSQKGIKQIKDIAQKIKKKNIDLIYSSDSQRTKETSQIVAKVIDLSKNNIFFVSELRDVHLGQYHNKNKKEFYNDFPKFDIKKRLFQAPYGGETWQECRKRIIDFVSKIDKKYKYKNILIVGHGDPLWLLERVIKELKDKEMLNKDYSKKNFIKTGQLRKLIINF